MVHPIRARPCGNLGSLRPKGCSYVVYASWLLLSPAAASSQTLEQADFFETRVRPVLAENCFACHSGGAEQPMGGLRVDTRDAVLRGGDRGPAVVSGKPAESRLIQAVRHKGLVMPPGGRLTEQQVADLEHWISLGAPWPREASAETTVAMDSREHETAAADHWAFQAFQAVDGQGSSDEVIDRLVRTRLKEAGLAPSERADPRTLLRRLSYGLTGLPPAFEQIQAFAVDPSPASYEREVDRLLSLPQFGERWARHWLDTARYADSGSTNVRFAFAYTYRDWVIQALNNDMPYDRFVVRQLAADLLPNEDKRHLAALGFLTLGLDPFRRTDLPEKMDDRIDVVTRGLMGLSVSCARCHDHKFDPIPTQDYYSLYGVFLNSSEPLEPTPTASADRANRLGEAYRARLERRVDSLRNWERKRLEEHRADARKAEDIERYLLGVWKGRGLTGPQLESLAREMALPSYLFNRWVAHVGRALDDPVFAVWNRIAELDEADYATSVQQGFSGSNRLVAEAFQRHPPESAEDIARLYAQVLAGSDSASPHADPDREALRLALRGPEAPPNIPLEDFWRTQNEGDKNTNNSLVWQYKLAAADYAYRVAPPHAMGLREADDLVPMRVFRRGNQNDLGQEAPRRFLQVLSREERKPFAQGSGRLELAQAIADAENPLTARVIVNRVWSHLLGKGLVETTSDFGTRGADPTHPELLDHLAATFVEDGWSIKRLIRRIVLSDAYQQSSAERPEAFQKDPENKLLWKMDRRRLDFEAQRDSLLAVAGRLDKTLGGQSFLPVSVPSVPRRTIYSFVERERTLPSLRSFDTADPAQHTPGRHVTTVPQQALFMMNSPFLAEQARALAASLAEGPREEWIRLAYRRIFGREPAPDEVRIGLDFLAGARSIPSKKVENVGAWQYGFGELDPVDGRVEQFVPFAYYAPLMKSGLGQDLPFAWKQASLLPAKDAGAAHLTANGGAPGDDLAHSVIRRWISPLAGKVDISGSLRHGLGDAAERFNYSNGVRGWIISNRAGVLASWTLRGVTAETSLKGVAVEEGEVLDFVVDSRGDDESDRFTWAPVIEEESDENPLRWSAADDFRGPPAEPLDAWAQYAQILMQSNEFSFVD